MKVTIYPTTENLAMWDIVKVVEDSNVPLVGLSFFDGRDTVEVMMYPIELLNMGKRITELME